MEEKFLILSSRFLFILYYVHAAKLLSIHSNLIVEMSPSLFY